MIFIIARIHPALILVVDTVAKGYESAIDESLNQAIALTSTS
jgi:hypothetical protein